MQDRCIHFVNYESYLEPVRIDAHLHPSAHVLIFVPRPADATSTYKPVQWCSAVLRQTDYTTFSQTKTTKTTHTDHEYTQPLVTKTDLRYGHMITISNLNDQPY